MKKEIFILIIISIFTVFIGCTNYQDEVIGTWNYQTFDTQPEGTVLWTFYDNGLLVRMNTSGSEIFYDSCEYVIDNSILKKKITFTGSSGIPGLVDINGLFRIDKLKDDILVMTRIRLPNDETAAAYLRCEMIRKH
ncbi:MAG TPA: hypothetical protein PLL66_05480 [Bacteroidales bacterium]|nr:hypothetical protein [Bacteroidales bacterium]